MSGQQDQQEMVPAFESAVGLKPEDYVMVPKGELEKWNEEMKRRGTHSTRSHVSAVNMAALFAKRAIRPDEVAALRRNMFDVVSKHIKSVEEVLDGKKTWSPTQVRLFGLLTERVMPKLSSITVDDSSTRKLEDMSLEELEAIALGKKKATAVDAVVKQAEVYDEAAEKRERRETKAEVLSELAHVVSIDDAEKAYIAEKAAISSAELARQTAKQFLKPQPAASPDRVAKARFAAKGVNNKDRWRAQGFTEEQIAEKEAERIKNWQEKFHRRQAALQRRIALNGGLVDGAKLPQQIDNIRRKTLKEFRVDPAKGVRTESAVAKERRKEAEKVERRLERRNNPRVFAERVIEGVDPAQPMRLQDLRAARPDLFEGENPKARETPEMPSNEHRPARSSEVPPLTEEGGE